MLQTLNFSLFSFLSSKLFEELENFNFFLRAFKSFELFPISDIFLINLATQSILLIYNLYKLNFIIGSNTRIFLFRTFVWGTSY